MAISRALPPILSLSLLISIALLSTVHSTFDFQFQSHRVDLLPTQSAACRDGSVGGCLEEEFQLDSEINRRILAATRYISYAALDKNSIPCSRRGVSYYNCQVGASVNPYTRGCSTIARCRG